MTKLIGVFRAVRTRLKTCPSATLFIINSTSTTLDWRAEFMQYTHVAEIELSYSGSGVARGGGE
jgi:hypothetical protein